MTMIDLSVPFHTRLEIEREDHDVEAGIVTVDARSEGPPLHLHADQDERWIVHRGVLSVKIGGRTLKLSAGETTEVPRGTAHTYWNEGSEECEFRYELSPGHRFTAMMRTFEALAREGKLRGTKDVRSIMHMAQVFVLFDDHVRGVAPPQWVMRAVAAVGRAFGVVRPFAPR